MTWQISLTTISSYYLWTKAIAAKALRNYCNLDELLCCAMEFVAVLQNMNSVLH